MASRLLIIMVMCATIVWPQLGLASQESRENSLEIIVHRDGKDLEIFLSMSALSIDPLLGRDPSIIFNDQGRIPIDQYRVTGSYNIAETLFANLTATSGGKAVELQAMSMMVHPNEVELPFRTPIDGVSAISICTTDYKGDGLLPEKVQLYYGGFGSSLPSKEAVELNFPATGRDRAPVTVHSFVNGVYVNSEKTTLADGASLSIDWQEADFQPMIYAGAAFAFASVFGFGVLFGYKNRMQINRR